MSSLSADILVSPQDLFSQVSNVSTTAPYDTGTPLLGTRAVTGDGREFRRAQNGGATAVVGNLQQSPAVIANHQNLATAAAAIGATSVTVTLGATATTANQYTWGWLSIISATGKSYQYQILSNPVATGSATCALTLVDPITVALDATSKSSLVLNPYSGTIINPTAPTGVPVGVAIFATTASYFHWIQVKGVATCLLDAAEVASPNTGTPVQASDVVAGAVMFPDAATLLTTPTVGTAYSSNVTDTNYMPVNLNLV